VYNRRCAAKISECGDGQGILSSFAVRFAIAVISRTSGRQSSAAYSDAKIEQVVVLDPGFRLVVPAVGESLVGMRLVDERRFAGKAPVVTKQSDLCLIE
jgi:hypothetical protein